MPLTSDGDIAALLGETRTIALVGASDRPDRASYRVMAFLQSRGYRVLPVNPQITGEHVHGEYVWRELGQIGEPIDMFRKMNVAVIGLIENMAGYACPHCGEVSDPFGSGGAEAAAKVMGIPFLGRVPLRMSIREASDAGTPPAAGEGEEADIFRGLAVKLLEQLG